MAVGDVPSEPRIKASLKQAWTNIWPNFWWLLLFAFLAMLASGPGGGGPGGDYSTTTLILDIGGGLIGIFVGIPLSMGVVKANLAASRGLKPTWKDLGYAFGPRYWGSIGLSLLSGLIVLGGLLLLIVPGIYWGVRISFAPYHFVERGLGVMESIRASRAQVTGRWWNVFGLALICIPLVIAGLLALLVGVFVAFVLIHQMWAVYWRSIPAERGPRTGSA